MNSKKSDSKTLFKKHFKNKHKDTQTPPTNKRKKIHIKQRQRQTQHQTYRSPSCFLKTPDNGIRAEDIKACDDETQEMVRQIFNEIVKQNEFTPEAWKKVRIKVRRGRCLETTSRSVLCQRCTNCSQQYCTADFFEELTKSKRKIRRDSEALTEQQTILRRTE